LLGTLATMMPWRPAVRPLTCPARARGARAPVARPSGGGLGAGFRRPSSIPGTLVNKYQQ
jgi:hypothetical protein